MLSVFVVHFMCIGDGVLAGLGLGDDNVQIVAALFLGA
jgi:hypothetical protein